MDIDQRLANLAERHEALTQSVELMARLSEERFKRLEQAQEKNEVLLEKNQILIAEIMESVNSLSRIAHAHEQRITGLEDRRQ